MKRLLLLLSLVALTACSGNLSDSECLALDETRTKLWLRSRQAAEEAGSIENPTRVARNEPCRPLMEKSKYDEWDACTLEKAQAAKVLTTNAELSELAGKDYVDDLVITTTAAQRKVDEARSWLKKGNESSARMEKGNCLL